MAENENVITLNNKPFIKRVIVIAIVGLVIVYIFGCFFLDPLLGIEYDPFASTFINAFMGGLMVFLFCVLILHIFKVPWEIEISKDYLILRDKRKHERKISCRQIRKIDKVTPERGGLKQWAIILDKRYWDRPDGNKIFIDIGNEVGRELQAIFERYRTTR
jgi:hypothetical protein